VSSIAFWTLKDLQESRQAAVYSLLVIGLVTLLSIINKGMSPASPWATPLMLGVMWTPGLVALGVQLSSEHNLRGFGWKPGAARYWALAYIFPFVYGGLALVAAQALGGGSISFERWSHGAVRWGLPEHALFGMLIQMTVFMIPGIVTGLGEEIGWRGFLVPRLARLFGFWGVVNTSFLIWLAFHMPGMLGGAYRGDGTPLWYSFICFAALLYPATVLMTWLRLRSRSLWPCVIQHAAHNCFIQVMWRSAFKTNDLSPWLLGEFGVLLPILSGLMVVALIVSTGLPRAGPVPLEKRDRVQGSEPIAAAA
jgi:membrane protease YdiL (CAAX protease family)